MANNLTLSSLTAAFNQLSSVLGAPAQAGSPANPLTLPVAASTAGSAAAGDLVTLGAANAQPLTYNAQGLLNTNPSIQALLSSGSGSMLDDLFGQSGDGSSTDSGNDPSTIFSDISRLGVTQMNQQLAQARAAHNQPVTGSNSTPDATNADTTSGSGRSAGTNQAANATSTIAKAIQQNPALLNQIMQSTSNQGLINILG
jgi:hypothetical protein